ncbi:hypothetical protein BD779DRAFT_1565784 [Infundibulicybe gibba]|nr:hypothetical protein BD779DRAFT_1565784 [Infundibulicybe gibba]
MASPARSVVRFFLPSPALTHVTPKDGYKQQLVHRRTTRRRTTNISTMKMSARPDATLAPHQHPPPSSSIMRPRRFVRASNPCLCLHPIPAHISAFAYYPSIVPRSLAHPPYSVSSGSRQVPLLHQLVCMARLRGICSAGWGGVGKQWACNTAVNSGVHEYRRWQSMQVSTSGASDNGMRGGRVTNYETR